MSPGMPGRREYPELTLSLIGMPLGRSVNSLQWIRLGRDGEIIEKIARRGVSWAREGGHLGL
jgi:hypothetical protein